MNLIEHVVIRDFLSKFSPTKSISRYSPCAKDIARIIQLSYPTESGGIYPITGTDIVDQAQAMGVAVQRSKDGTWQVGISAEDFNAFKNNRTHAVYSNDLICVHGPAKYSYVYDNKRNPIVKPICPHCANGFLAPSKSEVQLAVQYLGGTLPPSAPLPLAGALVIAGRKLKLRAHKTINGVLHLRRR